MSLTQEVTTATAGTDEEAIVEKVVGGTGRRER